MWYVFVAAIARSVADANLARSQIRVELYVEEDERFLTTTNPNLTTNLEIDHIITSADSLPTRRWIHSTTDTDISRWAQFHPLG